MERVDPDLFREAMSRFATGVTVVTATSRGERFGITASSFVSVSADPPLVLACLARVLHTHAAIEESRAFAVNILGVHQVMVGRRFAGLTPEAADRFVGLPCSTSVTGSPLLDESLASFDCRLYGSHDGGDHTIFVGEVVDARIHSDEAPLLYHNRLWRRSEVLEIAETLKGSH